MNATRSKPQASETERSLKAESQPTPEDPLSKGSGEAAEAKNPDDDYDLTDPKEFVLFLRHADIGLFRLEYLVHLLCKRPLPRRQEAEREIF